MAGLLIKAIIPALAEYIDKALTGAPAQIKLLLANIVKWLPTTIDKAVEVFRTTYVSATERLAKWLPTQEATLTKLTLQAGDWLKKRLDTLS
jgi:hypothetical protein